MRRFAWVTLALGRLVRIAMPVAAMTLLALIASPVQAQPPPDSRTHTLTIHGASLGPNIRVLSGVDSGRYLVSECSVAGNNPCTVVLNQGSTIEIAGGPFTGGTGPAAACALSTCTFSMTADADITVTSAAGPFATVTTTAAGTGTLWRDGAACQSATCATQYLVGSTVQMTAAPLGSARFSGYSAGTGDASVCGTSAACTFTVTGDTSVTATFDSLTSFTVTPATAFGVPLGPPQTFSATGTYSGGSTAPIDSTFGAWSTAPSLPSGRANLGAAAVAGKIYAVGSTAANVTQNLLTEFDPATQAWTARAPMLSVRGNLATATAGGRLYAIGGCNSFCEQTNAVAAVDRYDPTTDTWTAQAPLSAPRQNLVAGTINGIIYAAGGEGPPAMVLGTLEAYDPATNTWTQKAPMPTPRARAAGGVVNGILYVVGGGTVTSPLSTVEAYDPATNTWSARLPLPVPLAGGAAAVADGVLYVMSGRLYRQSVVYAYDPVTDTWSVKTPMITPLNELAAVSLSGVVYAIGGSSVDEFHSVKAATTVQTFVDGLRWSSSAPLSIPVSQTGRATALSPGTATIVANVGGASCGGSCPTFIVPGSSTMSLDLPTVNSSVTSGAGFSVGGWALNAAAPSGTGVDAIHVYAFPATGAAIFLGVAPYGQARPDVAALHGAQFTNSGFSLPAAGSTLTPGTYTIFAAAHDAMTGAFDAAKTTTIRITAPISSGVIALDTPTLGETVTSAFEVGGWAADFGSPTGTGVDGVQFYIQPRGAAGPGVLIGTGSYGGARPDVGGIFGSRFTNVGYHFTITGLGPGSFTLNVLAHSTVTNGYSIVKSLSIAVSATALMSIDAPAPEQLITAPQFLIGGWTIDRTVEGTQLTGPGVDIVHVYAYPNPGSGQPPIFLGMAFVGVNRPDVAGTYGARYDTSGYNLVVDRAASGLIPGVYSIAAHAHSTVTDTFNNVAVVRITLR